MLLFARPNALRIQKQQLTVLETGYQASSYVVFFEKKIIWRS